MWDYFMGNWAKLIAASKLLKKGTGSEQSVLSSTTSRCRETPVPFFNNPQAKDATMNTGRTNLKMHPSTGASQDKAVILVIDDDPDIVAGLAKVLSAAGHVAHCCADAAGAIECIRRVTPDLIISDINLAGSSGLQLCERLKKEEGLTDVPLIFLSGAQLPDIIRRSREAGAIYYLRKPFDHNVLLELVDKALWMPHLTAAHAGE